jgi:hypothetical protein
MTEHLGQMSLYQARGDGLWAIGKRLEARGGERIYGHRERK